MKLSDYVVQFIADLGVKHVFMLPGGGAMHLNDSLGRNPDVEFVCNLHEQACAIAAEAYARVTNNIGVAMVTTGPGGTNAITGLAGAWLDSIPCLFISGQVKRADMIGDSGLRQLGVQEIDIVSIVRPLTKYAISIMDPNEIRYHLEKAIYLAKSGRPGPVWLDIPLDVQAALVHPDIIPAFDSKELSIIPDEKDLETLVSRALKLLKESERPVILAGNGIRVAGAQNDFVKLVEALQVPVLTTWAAIDLIPDAHPLFAGRPGAIAPRGANFTLQNSDFLLVIGSRLDLAITGYTHEKFAPCAKKVMVDVDRTEIEKMRTKIDLPIHADAKDFINEILRQLHVTKTNDHRTEWLDRCKTWRTRYPVVGSEYRDEKHYVSSYVFSDIFSDEAASDDIIVPTSAGVSIELFFLAFRIKNGQRMFHDRGTGAMGLALPASIGACLGSGGKRTLCIDGDGSFQMNIQELETIKRLNLPIKIFVLNNQGYASIRASQQRYFGKLSGADVTSGLSLPDLSNVANAYGLTVEKISCQTTLRDQIRKVLNTAGPIVCEVMIEPYEIRAPSITSRQMPNGSMTSTPLEDLWPFLDRSEFHSNMLVPTRD